MDFFKGEDPKPAATDQPAAKLVVPPVSSGEPEQPEPTAPVQQAKEKETGPARRLPPAPPLDPAQLRRAANLIVPLLTDRDPGAKDCLHDNRMAFRSAFTPEGYVEFEQLVKGGDFETALEQLKKAGRKHGLAL
jgi:hypothetical protein